jgi:hypothetical protein
LGLDDSEWKSFKAEVIAGDRSRIPGAVRASCGISTTDDDVDALLEAVAEIARTPEAGSDYFQERSTGDFQLHDPETPGPPEAPAYPGRPCNA